MNPFQANWKTASSGYLETVCVIIIALCALPAEVWQNPKVWIPSVLLLVAKTIKDTLTKDKNVTGGTVQQTVSGAKADEGTQSLVDDTVIASIKSGDANVTLEQREAVKNLPS